MPLLLRLAPAVLTVTSGARAAAQGDSVAFTPDTIRAFDGRAVAVDRLTLRVREPGAGNSVFEHRVVSLVMRGPDSTKRPPLVFLMGGPGIPASLIARVPPYLTLFERLRASGDVVLLDQRGTGLSTPSLDCPAGAPPDSGLLLSLEHLTRDVARVYAACAGRLRAAGVPMEAYATAAVAEDVDRVRRALGSERVRLLGMSYGTLLALEYAERFPDRVDRVALQGAMGREHGARRPKELDALFDRLAAAVARDSVGMSLTSDLRRDVAALLRAFDARPRVVSFPDTKGDTVRLPVGGDRLRAVISGRLGDTRLPALVSTLKGGDARVLAQLVGSLYRDLAQGGGPLFGRAMYCSSPPSEARTRAARAEAAGTLLGPIFDNAVYEAAFCGEIGFRFARGDPPPLRPVARPALIVGGTLDDRTPLDNAKDLLPVFARASLVTVENGGHELLVEGDVREVVARFLAGDDVASLTLKHAGPHFATVAEALAPPRRR